MMRSLFFSEQQHCEWVEGMQRNKQGKKLLSPIAALRGREWQGAKRSEEIVVQWSLEVEEMIIAVSAAASEASNIIIIIGIGSVMAPITRSCRITTQQQQPQSSCRLSASTAGKKASIGGKVCELDHGAEGDGILLPSFVGEKITTTRKQELVRVSRAVKVDRKQQYGEKKLLRAAKKRLKSRSRAADDGVDEEEEEEAENLALVSSADDIEDFWPLQQQQQQQLPSETFSFSAEEVVDIRSSLLSWYDRNHRVLPWRLNPHSLLQAPPIVVVDGTGVKQQEKNVQPKAATSTTTKPDNHQPVSINFSSRNLQSPFLFFRFVVILCSYNQSREILLCNILYSAPK